MLRRHRACGRRSDVGQPTFIHQYEIDGTGPLTEHHDHTVADGQPAIGIVRERRRDLDDVGITAYDRAVLDMDVARRIVEMEEPNWWHLHLTLGVEHEARFDILDQLRDIDQLLDLIHPHYRCHPLSYAETSQNGALVLTRLGDAPDFGAAHSSAFWATEVKAHGKTS